MPTKVDPLPHQKMTTTTMITEPNMIGVVIETDNASSHSSSLSRRRPSDITLDASFQREQDQQHEGRDTPADICTADVNVDGNVNNHAANANLHKKKHRQSRRMSVEIAPEDLINLKIGIAELQSSLQIEQSRSSKYQSQLSQCLHDNAVLEVRVAALESRNEKLMRRNENLEGQVVILGKENGGLKRMIREMVGELQNEQDGKQDENRGRRDHVMVMEEPLRLFGSGRSTGDRHGSSNNSTAAASNQAKALSSFASACTSECYRTHKRNHSNGLHSQFSASSTCQESGMEHDQRHFYRNSLVAMLRNSIRSIQVVEDFEDEKGEDDHDSSTRDQRLTQGQEVQVREGIEEVASSSCHCQSSSSATTEIASNTDLKLLLSHNNNKNNITDDTTTKSNTNATAATTTADTTIPTLASSARLSFSNMNKFCKNLSNSISTSFTDSMTMETDIFYGLDGHIGSSTAAINANGGLSDSHGSLFLRGDLSGRSGDSGLGSESGHRPQHQHGLLGWGHGSGSSAGMFLFD
mmetsp:Transcript_10233/g.21245  ORF Transcript_10233/g.21245 Transcript_10233/m.21245 type:complete len:524 (-) Transcript_10233:36-1607(-)